LKDELLKKADEGWVHLRSAVPHHELPSFLQCLDLMILGSHPVRSGGTCWEEQFGHSMIEAAACGALALGAASGAIPEVLGDPDLTFAPGDVSAIRQLIERFSTDADYLQQKKAAQRARLLRHYTHAAVADRCAQFLLSLPQRNAKPFQALPSPCPR
jgi:glycosyltransferase involved in cell wall biosynthesis